VQPGPSLNAEVAPPNGVASPQGHDKQAQQTPDLQNGTAALPQASLAPQGCPAQAGAAALQPALAVQAWPAAAFPHPGAVPGSPWQGPYCDGATGRYYYFNLLTRQSEWAASPMPVMYPAHYAMAGGYPMYQPLPIAPVPQDPLAAYSLAASAACSSTPAYDPLGQAVDRREQCSDFKRGKCDRGAACKYAHIKPTEECGDFKRGRCTRGSTCKYLHLGEGGVTERGSRSRSR